MSGPSDRGSEPPRPDADSPVLRFATFNIRHGADPEGRVRMGRLARACTDLHADVLGLQEVQGGRRHSWYLNQGAVVARWQRARHAAGPAHHRGLLKTYGNSLVVRGGIDDVAILDLPRGEEREPRAALLARVSVRGIEVSVAVTHLQHTPQRFAHLVHDAPDQLRSVLDALRERPGPRVLLGDLNLDPEATLPIFAAAGMTVAEHGPSFPAKAPRRCIDYIAVDGLEIRRAWVADRSPVSDHRAVVAELAPASSAS
ncbi:MAG: endonuclease/exonuclease/phosphatase family protein [Acidimicrobiia bacterium]